MRLSIPDGASAWGIKKVGQERCPLMDETKEGAGLKGGGGGGGVWVGWGGGCVGVLGGWVFWGGKQPPPPQGVGGLFVCFGGGGGLGRGSGESAYRKTGDKKELSNRAAGKKDHDKDRRVHKSTPGRDRHTLYTRSYEAWGASQSTGQFGEELFPKRTQEGRELEGFLRGRKTLIAGKWGERTGGPFPAKVARDDQEAKTLVQKKKSFNNLKKCSQGGGKRGGGHWDKLFAGSPEVVPGWGGKKKLQIRGFLGTFVLS